MQVNIWKFIYLNIGGCYEEITDHRSYAPNLNSCEIKAWRKLIKIYDFSYIHFYYPTALRRVQITPKTSTNITRYLYSRGPIRQVSSYWPISYLDFPRQFHSASHTSITHSLWINIHEIRSHEHANLACWIISLLLDVLLCSIAENFYSLFVFDSPYGLAKIRHNS